jgi:hypothetical protein
VVANKKQIRTTLKKISMLKTWQLIILLILVLFIAATALRLNNVGMDQRREGVYSADEAGDEDIIHQRLLSLREYSSSHMNANTGAFVLKNQYDRDSQRALADAQNKSEESESPNGNIYKKAAEVCDPQFSGYSQAYMQCFMKELNKYPESGAVSDSVVLPTAELYQYDFASPIWTPDIAGWTVLLAIIISVVIITKITLTVVLSMFLKRRAPKI